MAALVLLLAGAIGWLGVRALWPRELLRSTRVVRAALAFGVGASATSLVAFVVLLGADRLAPGWLLAGEAALLLVLAAANARHRAPTLAAPTPRPPLPPPPALGALPRALLAVVAVVVVAALATFVLATLRDPHGQTDALAIWNLRARLLCGEPGVWREALGARFAVTHPDYPLLVPAFAASAWQWAGAPSPWVPAAIAGGFTFATAALLFAALAALRSPTAGAVAAVALLAFPAFAGAGATQLADVPLAFFALAAVALLALHDHAAPRARGLLVLAGFAAASAAWTKNEGLLFVVVLLGVRALALVRRGAGARALAGEAVALGLGAAPAAAALLVLKLGLVPANDLVAEVAAGHAAARLLDGTRYLDVATALLHEAWALGPAMLLATLAWAALARRGRLGQPLAVAGAMLGGYVLVYLVASHSLKWHLATSLQRLLLHLLPLVLLGVFAGAPAPRARGAAGVAADG